MASLAFSSLRGRLILLVLIAVIPALGLIVYSAVEERRHIAEDVKKEALTLTQLTASNLDNFIEGARQLLISLAETQVVRNRDSAACNERFAALMKQNSLYQTIGATDEVANVFASAVPLKQPVNVRDRQWFRSVLQSRNFVVGDFIMGRITGKPTLALAYPVLDKRGVFKGTVFVTVDLTWLNQMAKEANLAPGRTLTVVDRHGTIIARYPEPGQWVGKIVSETNLVKTILTQKEGLAEIRGLDGIQRLYAFTLIHGAVDTGLYLSIGLSKEMAFKKIDQTLYRNLVALGLVAALALAVAWVGGDRLILRRVKSLVEASKRLRNGDLGARTGLSYQNGEISQLAHAFDEMAAALEQREAERKQAEEALEKALHAWQNTFEAVSDGLWILDAEGHIIHSNGKFELLLGVKPQEVLNQICYQVVHCSSYFIEDCPCMKMFKTGKPEKQEIEDKNRGLWLEVSADPLRDKTGAVVSAVHIVRNITKRKQLEAQLFLSQKYEALGTLAGGIAHDFNNLLTAIMSNLELAGFKREKGESLESYLEEIERITERAALLTKQLLAFSRRQIIQPLPLNLNDIIANMTKMLSRVIGEHIELELRLEKELGTVKVDPGQEEKISVETVKEKPTLIRGKEVILLAEDEDNLREAIQNILEIFGYTVLVAQDGREAVDIYEQEKERIDLVILDAVMPKMGGKEVADRIYKLNPSQKILFSSGYSAEGLHETFIIPADMHFIQKPYTAKALAQKVREMLEG